ALAHLRMSSLAHLTAWANMVQEWYAAGLRGEVPPTPAPGLTWQQVPILNQRIYDQNKDRPLADIRADFDRSYQQLSDVIPTIPEEVLFTRGHYSWTKSTTLGAYFVSCGGSHYHWARELIRKWAKARA
ncbi:MAG TPA: ClbS/DfsB family four-helix bundle protein, partial [Phototrophicaceae bacterium]|nr:ClbS/DfsB family four-helix bundle protein [Phototrophicaceae bacterium]